MYSFPQYFFFYQELLAVHLACWWTMSWLTFSCLRWGFNYLILHVVNYTEVQALFPEVRLHSTFWLQQSCWQETNNSNPPPSLQYPSPPNKTTLRGILGCLWGHFKDIGTDSFLDQFLKLLQRINIINLSSSDLCGTHPVKLYPFLLLFIWRIPRLPWPLYREPISRGNPCRMWPSSTTHEGENVGTHRAIEGDMSSPLLF